MNKKVNFFSGYRNLSPDLYLIKRKASCTRRRFNKIIRAEQQKGSRKMKKLSIIFPLVLFTCTVFGKEYHVSTGGLDTNDGSHTRPFKTISAAAQIAQPGDVITVHAGTYRERITPPRGGESESKRIVYRAAEGEEVIIKGSEIVSGWQEVDNGVWKVLIPNSFFGGYNPYRDLIEGDWFDDRGRIHHTGEVFLNGRSLYEKATLVEVQNPQPHEDSRDKEFSIYTWYCESNEAITTIWANFQQSDPNKEIVEISVRETCFYPDAPGRNYITLRGFHLSQAATQWAAPTAEQIGLIGTHWSKGWIIEDNIISDSKCSGITLGKDRKTGHNVWLHYPQKDGAIHYIEVIFRALQAGWSKENIGSHVVQNNTIFNCEQTGICGSLGAVFSTITNNHIHDIWTKRQFSGAEIAGIKLHAAIDVLLEKNHIHNAGRGFWMDWMAQGTRITANLCYDNTIEDLYFEVDHGPHLVDNNIFLSELALTDMSECGAYIHNLFGGSIKRRPESRYTPYHFAHSTSVAGLITIAGGDDRFYNNIFIGRNEKLIPGPDVQLKVGYGLAVYNEAKQPVFAAGNIYLKNAQHYGKEVDYIEDMAFDPQIRLVEKEKSFYLQINYPPSVQNLRTEYVDTELLGKAFVSGLPYENPDGSPLKIDKDYFGKQRNDKNPTSGPFENPGQGALKIKVW
jgi:hypothetical protein